MSRDIAAGTAAAAAAEVVRPFLLVELDFSSGFVRVNTTPYTLVHETNNYLGIGDLGRVEAPEESAGLSAPVVELELSGIPPTHIATALGEAYQGRSCKIWLGFLDEDHAIVDTPVLMFSGSIDTLDVVDVVGDGSAGSITVTAESELIEWERPRVLRYTTEAQQELFPGDKGLSHVSSMQDFELKWGG